jgi:hypothetical protein
MTTESVGYPSIRNCDGCTLCCKIIGIEELDNPAGTWCPHCKIGAGCAIYERRPKECRTFRCAYLVDPALDERWKPSESKIVLITDTTQKRIEAHVDPHRPMAWRLEPVYAQLKTWSRSAVQNGAQVVVFVARHAYVILPDRDVDLGVLDEDDVIVTRTESTIGGIPTYNASKTRRGDISP